MNALSADLQRDLDQLVPSLQSTRLTETVSPEAEPLADILTDWLGLGELSHLSETNAEDLMKELWPWTDGAIKADIHRLRGMLDQLMAAQAMDPSTITGQRQMRRDIDRSVAKSFQEDMAGFSLPEIKFEDLLGDSKVSE